jgi:MFS family permease
MSGLKRQAWLIAIALFVMDILVFGSTFDTMGVFVTPLIRHYHLSHAKVASLTTAATVTLALFSPVSGWLLEFVEARLVIVGGAVLAMLAFIGASNAVNFTGLMCAYLLLGAGLGLGTLTPVAVVITRWFREQRGAPMGLAIAGTTVGGMVLIPVANYVATAHGLRTAYLTMVAATTLAIPIILATIRGHPPSAAPQPSAPAARAPRPDPLPGYDILAAAATRSFWMINLAQLFYGFQVEGTAIHLIPHVIGSGYSANTGALVLSTVMGLGAAAKFGMGVLSDRIGAKAALVMAFVSSAIGEMLLISADRPAFLALALIGIAIGFGSQSAIFPILLAQCLGLKRFAVLQGLTGFVLYAGVGIGPMVLGWLYDISGKYTVSFEFCAAAAALAALATLACKPFEEVSAEVSSLEVATPAS